MTKTALCLIPDDDIPPSVIRFLRELGRDVEDVKERASARMTSVSSNSG